MLKVMVGAGLAPPSRRNAGGASPTPTLSRLSRKSNPTPPPSFPQKRESIFSVHNVCMSTIIHQRVELARKGEYEKTICRLTSGWAVLGDVQFLRGYSLLLPDPVVPHLNALSPIARSQFLSDMALLGQAVLNVTGALRINYEILGNQDPALHAHVFPRFDNEPAELKTRPVWFYDWKAGPGFDLGRDGELMERIASEIRKLVAN